MAGRVAVIVLVFVGWFGFGAVPAGARPVGCFVAVDDPDSTLTTTGVGKDVVVAETLAWANACTLHGLPAECRGALALVDRHEVTNWRSDVGEGESTVSLTTQKRLGGYGEGETESAACAVASERACARRGKETCRSAHAEQWVIAVHSEPWVCAVIVADDRKVQRVSARAPTEGEVLADLKRRAPAEARPLLSGKSAKGGWALKKVTTRHMAHEDDWIEHEWVLERGAKVHVGSGGGADAVEACAAARAAACKVGHVAPCASGGAVEMREVVAPRAPGN